MTAELPESEQSAIRNLQSAIPEHLIVGQVVAPFGVRGELKVNILTEFPERFGKLDEVILAPFSSIEPGLAPRAALDPATVRGPVRSAASGPSRQAQVATGPTRPT